MDPGVELPDDLVCQPPIDCKSGKIFNGCVNHNSIGFDRQIKIRFPEVESVRCGILIDLFGCQDPVDIPRSLFVLCTSSRL